MYTNYPPPALNSYGIALDRGHYDDLCARLRAIGWKRYVASAHTVRHIAAPVELPTVPAHRGAPYARPSRSTLCPPIAEQLKVDSDKSMLVHCVGNTVPVFEAAVYKTIRR